MAPTVPTTEPSLLRAGETWAWDVALSDFPPSDGYTLVYTLVGPSKLTITAEAAGSVYQARASAAETADLLPGTYQWVAQASLPGADEEEEGDDELYPTGRAGALTVLPNLAVATTSVSHAAKTLPLVEAAIEAHLTGNMAGVKAMNINGRAADRHSIEELYALRAKYAREVAAEQAIAQGRSPFTSVAAVMRAPSC